MASNIFENPNWVSDMIALADGWETASSVAPIPEAGNLCKNKHNNRRGIVIYACTNAVVIRFNDSTTWTTSMHSFQKNYVIV